MLKRKRRMKRLCRLKRSFGRARRREEDLG